MSAHFAGTARQVMANQLRKPVELARLRSQLEDNTAHLERSDDKILANNNCIVRVWEIIAFMFIIALIASCVLGILR